MDVKKLVPVLAGAVCSAVALLWIVAESGLRATEPADQEKAIKILKGVLSREYHLKPNYKEGQRRSYRLWMTWERFDSYGNVSGRQQWRGDLERVVTSVDSSGRAEEKVTWKNVGLRNWVMNDDKYGPHQALPWAEGFSYQFSAEDDYSEIHWEYPNIPNDMLGFMFRGGLQVSAHYEFDFMRSSRHAAIEKLRRAGELLRHTPEEGKAFNLDFPPLITNSRLERKNVQVGFLGLTLANDEPCALIDYRQGPQNFSWITQPSEGARLSTQMESLQRGMFAVRLADGSLVNGELVEDHIVKSTLVGRGVLSIREITPEEFAKGLKNWEKEQAPVPRFRREVGESAVPSFPGDAEWVDTAGNQRPKEGRSDALSQIRDLLKLEYNLKPKFSKGGRRYYRLWMTIESPGPRGNTAERNQWRGDFERVVISVDPSDRAEEEVTWRNVGVRRWLLDEGKYASHQPLPWADGFSYRFSMEDSYEELDWDYSSIPKNVAGFVFRAILQVTAHYEFDFLRSSRHASIEKLRYVGAVLRDPPEEGQVFNLDFPPVFTNSRLERKHVEIGVLGLAWADDEPCALIDYRQGPQRFSWTMTTAAGEQAEPVSVNTELTSRQEGVFVVRLEDGSLVNGWLAESTIQRITPAGGGEPTGRYTRGIWHIREITSEEFAGGLKDWENEQTPTPQFRPEPSK
jgi:hypothetical protein